MYSMNTVVKFWTLTFQLLTGGDPGILGHAVEDGLLVGEQLLWAAHLRYPALLQHHHTVAVHDRVQPEQFSHLKPNFLISKVCVQMDKNINCFYDFNGGSE